MNTEAISIFGIIVSLIGIGISIWAFVKFLGLCDNVKDIRNNFCIDTKNAKYKILFNLISEDKKSLNFTINNYISSMLFVIYEAFREQYGYYFNETGILADSLKPLFIDSLNKFIKENKELIEMSNNKHFKSAEECYKALEMAGMFKP